MSTEVLEELRLKLDFAKVVEVEAESYEAAGLELVKYDWLHLFGENRFSPCRDWNEL